MNSKKLQQVFFSFLIVLSIFSSLYLNLHVEPKSHSIAEFKETAEEVPGELMADIDAFKNIIRNVAEQIVF